MSYDDMMGLEFGEYGGLGALVDTEMLKDTAIASVAGVAVAAGAGWAIQQLTEKVDFLKREDPGMQKVQTGAIQFALGIGAGTLAMRYGASQPMALGATIVLGGLGVLNIWNGLVAKDKPLSLSAMPEDMELSEGYDGSSMEALAALEATNVSAAPGAFQGFADPTVTPEALMGTVVQEESLGSLGAYAPYLA